MGGGGGAGVGAADVGVGVFTLILDISFSMWQTRRPMCSTPCDNPACIDPPFSLSSFCHIFHPCSIL